MTLISFFVLVVVVVLLGWLCTWVIGMLAPGHPGIIDNIIWVLCVLIIVVALLQALGVMHGGPVIPHV
jgi:hypothetical protein